MYSLYKNLIKDYKYVINYKAIVQIWFRRQSSKYIMYYKELVEICNIIVHKLVIEEIQVTYNLFIIDIFSKILKNSKGFWHLQTTKIRNSLRTNTL